jgi:Ca-activated chloride channel family protein
MTQVLPVLTDDEVRRSIPPDDEAGFGALSTAKGNLPLKAMDIQGKIDGLLSEVTLCQTFVNPFTEPLEATYIFPLPDRAAVTRFRMEVAGRVIEGVLKERGAARKEYTQAIQEGHRAAITEEERPGVFTLRVGNLMPGEAATIHLSLSGPLPYSDGEATFRFPLVVAPRYIPGSPLPGPGVGDGTAMDTDAVPDASRITPPVLLPGYPNPVRLSLTIDVGTTGLKPHALRSSLHTVLVEAEDGQVQRVRLQPGERLNRDFVLRIRLGTEAVQTVLALQPDADGKGQAGTFLLSLLPPTGAEKAARPRDLVFVLDRSGSMGGWKMVAARRALARLVDTLTERDRFTIYAFDDRIETPPAFPGEGLVAATYRQRSRAVEFLTRIDARGGTEMAQPLDRAVQQLADGGAERDGFLVLITDGQIGNEDQILRSLGPRVRNLRIFTLGIDQAVNAGFLKRLAALGGGSCELVESEERLEEVMDALHRRITTPELTELHLEPDGFVIEPDSLVPGRMPHLFAGAPLFLLGRYQGKAKSLLLEGTDARRQKWSATVPATRGDHPAVAAVWARGHLRELEDRYAVGQDDHEELEQRIVATSLKYGVLCRFTAYVAVDRSEVVNEGAAGQKIVQPVEAPAGWETLRGFGAMRACAPSAMGTPAYMAPEQAEFEAMRPCLRSGGSFRTMAGMAAPEVTEELERRAPLLTRKSAGEGLAHGVGGILSRLLKTILGNSGRRKDVPPPVLDLTAYRKRSLELLDHLQKGAAADPGGRLSELGVFAEKLTALVADLKTIGAPKALYRPLEKLLVQIQALLAKENPFASKIAKLWLKAEEVLRAFVITEFGTGAAAPEKPAAEGRDNFWK